jgi:site-specific recombinase XerD
MNRNLNLLFFLRRKQVDNGGLSPIYLRMTVNGERAEMSTKRKIDINEWDANRQRARGRSEKARILNEYLDNMENKVKKDFNYLNDNDELVKLSDLKDLLEGKFQKNQTLLILFEMNNRLIKNEEGSKYVRSTIEQYKLTVTRLKQFLMAEYNCEDLDLQKLDILFIRRFETFLSTTFSIHHNTVMKHLKQLKKVIHFGMELGYLQKDPFMQHTTAYKETNRGHLTEEELRRIESHKFIIPRLDRIRDVFLFVCYTGMSYSDLKLLDKNSVFRGIDGKSWIVYERKKTGVQARLPLLPKAQEIVDKYKNDPECVSQNKLIPLKSNQKLNSYLAEISELCGIDKHVTMHLGRHTFATTVTLTNGVSIESVSKMLGHTSLKTTQIYSKVVDTKISNDMDELATKLMQKDAEIENGDRMKKIGT